MGNLRGGDATEGGQRNGIWTAAENKCAPDAVEASGALPFRAIVGLVAEACTTAGLPVWTTHGLRRAFVTRGIRAGIDIATLASITGHTVEVMLSTYRQVQEEDVTAASELLPGALPRGEVVAFRGR